jgi:hypothetical protein
MMKPAHENRGTEKSWKANGKKNEKDKRAYFAKRRRLQHPTTFIFKVVKNENIKSSIFGIQTLEGEGDTFS